MPIKKVSGLRGTLATVAASSLLSGCDDGMQNKADLVNIENPNAVSMNTNWVQVSIPDALISSPQDKVIDLLDATQVAKAMKIVLNGNPDQLLYNIEISVASRGHSSGIHKKMPVTVSTIAEGADFINNIENRLISERARKAIDPNALKKHVEKAGRIPETESIRSIQSQSSEVTEVTATEPMPFLHP